MKILKKNVLKLRPTQFSVGFKEVDAKVKKLKKMTAKQRRKYQEDKLIPCVLSPNKELYMIDHHHAVRACWEAGVKKVHVKVIADFSNMHITKFWRTMEDNKWVYLHDQFGTFRIFAYDILPQDVRGLADDPYRSLAWAVKEAGGFAKSEIPFFEFKWANLFRKRVNAKLIRDNFDLATRKATTIARKHK